MLIVPTRNRRAKYPEKLKGPLMPDNRSGVREGRARPDHGRPAWRRHRLRAPVAPASGGIADQYASGLIHSDDSNRPKQFKLTL